MTRRPRRTRTFSSLESLEARLCLSALPAGTATTVPDAATQVHLSAAYGQLPLSFEVNKGQTDPRVNFLTQGAGYTAFLTRTGAVMELQQGDGGNVVRMKIVGANPGARPVGLDKQAGVSNDFVGNDPAQWHTNIANYAGVDYQHVYRGIDVVYHGDQRQLEYDFVVEPGANAGTIRLSFDGIQRKALDSQGNLVLHTSGGDVLEHAPVAYQTINGVRQPIASRFVMGHGGQVGFQVGRYDHSKSLVIDPVLSLSYSTYLGGAGSYTKGFGIAVDGSGDAYVTGVTNSAHFPTTPGAFIKKAAYSAFVTKFNAAGSALVYSTFLGSAVPSAIAVDSSGNAYVTGYTTSASFPTKNPLQATYGGTGPSGHGDAFVTKLNATGSALIYSTYLGGSADDEGRGIAVDSSGDAFVTGVTMQSATNFPTTAGSLQPVIANGYQAFAAAVNPTGSAFLYSTILGGAAATFGDGIALDGSGNAYVTGYAQWSNFPTTPGAVLTGSAGGAFVAKLNTTGSALVYAAQLGGSSGADKGYRIAVDGSGKAAVTGIAISPDFPTTSSGYQTTSGGSGDAFVTELNAAGTALVYSTFLGGGGQDNRYPNDTGGGIAVDGSGNIYVTGTTWGINFPSSVTDNFPTKNAVQSNYGGGQFDAFAAEINPSQVGAASLVYSTYLGGGDQDASYGIAVDSSGNAYVAGFSFSLNYPTTTNAYQPHRTPQTTLHALIGDAFVTKLTFN